MTCLRLFLGNPVSPAQNLSCSFNADSQRSAVSLRSKGRHRFFACLVPETALEKLVTQASFGEKSKEVIEAEASLFVRTYARAPVVFQSGKGCKLYDVEGREYLDMTAGIAVNSLGYCDPDWVRAVVEQANTLTHVSNVYYSIPQKRSVIVRAYTRARVVFQSGKGCKLYDVEGREYLDMTAGIAVNSLGHGDLDWVKAVVEQVVLGKRLVECSFADRVFFSNSGTEANEAAIKFARKFQKFSNPDEKQLATEFISFSNSFHGRTMGALALTSKVHYRSPFEPVMPGVTFIEYGNMKAAKDAIQPGKTAAVFVEPIQGEGGIYSATKEFLQALRAYCDDAGALLVFDEVQCGLGRTGHLWAHEIFGVFPDMMTLAKPLAGGLPIGVVLMTGKVAAAISSGDHGSTFAGGPLVCHAALAVLDKIQKPGFLAAVSMKGKYLKQLLVEKLGRNPHVKEVRGVGLIVGIELDVSASPLVDACRDAGLLILTAGKGNVVRLVPPLVISEAELERAAETLLECIHVLDANTKN